MKTAQNYIPEIDTLRAIAVGLVLLFHAFPVLAPNGFLGVDIFFVISGFVISRIYLTPLTECRVSLVDFYLARIRRLTPALVVTIVATSIAAHAILSPRDLKAFANSLLYQPIYLQNISYWLEGDYFTLPLRKPLLHTWSLAIEEQFYLVWGLLVLFCRRRSVAVLRIVIIISVLLSLALFLALTISNVSPRTAFYLLPSRPAWIWYSGIFHLREVTGNREGPLDYLPRNFRSFSRSASTNRRCLRHPVPDHRDLRAHGFDPVTAQQNPASTLADAHGRDVLHWTDFISSIPLALATHFPSVNLACP